MREDDVGSLPVVESERLIGMITDRDIVVRGVATGADVSSTTVRQTMSSGVVSCFADQSVEEASRTMAEAKVRRLPVVDRDRRLIGIVSLGDLARNEPAPEAGEALRAISEPTGSPRAV